jgi:hypothetical protein
MLLKERLAALFEPKEVKEIREITAKEAARIEEGRVTVAYLRGEVSMEEYQQTLDKLYPLIKLDLRKLAQELKR